MRASSFLALGALLLTGCAKFPKDEQSDFTRLIFTIRFNGPVDTRSIGYVYAVAIRPLTSTVDPQDNLAPAPLVTFGAPNGIVLGRPTRLVRYAPGASLNGFQIYRFDNAPTDASDPSPGNLAFNNINGVDRTDVLPTNVLDPSQTGSDPTRLGFEISTRDLADSDDAARAIVAFQFNILTMNKAALNSGDVGGRLFDALGDQRSSSTTSFNNARKIIITTSGRYVNTPDGGGGQPAAIPEVAGDVFGGNLPAIDIVDYSVEVRPQ